MHPLLTHCERHADAIVETTTALARLESPSTDKAAVDRCGLELLARLRAAGADVRVIAQETRGDHVRASIGGDDRPVLLLGHFDTVWPVGTLARMPVESRDGRLHGPGVFDMKAGIAIALAAVDALRGAAAAMPPLVMLWTTDEEIGSGTSRALIEAEARRARAVLVLEPSLPGGAVKTSRKGCGEFTIDVRGIAAHAGIDPTKGASAIHEVAEQIRAVQALANPARGISVNVGVVEGGSRPNVVAEHARAVVDVRVPTAADGERVTQAFAELRPIHAGTQLTVTGGFERPPLERSSGVAALFELARAVAGELGRDLGEGGTGGGSDGNFTAALGVRTLDGLGAVGDGAHAQHEYVEIAALAWRTALVAGLLNRLSGLG
jgi:glutamate carboxypeptidase